MPCRTDARKWVFRHYMAQIDPIFPPKSGLGSKFPSLGSANPWDGNRFPWDVSAEGPHGRTKTTLKGGRTCASALTLCHIAHRGGGPAGGRSGTSLRRGHKKTSARLLKRNRAEARVMLWPAAADRRVRLRPSGPRCGASCRASAERWALPGRWTRAFRRRRPESWRKRTNGCCRHPGRRCRAAREASFPTS